MEKTGQFKLKSPFSMTGDQPEAVARLVEGLRKGKKHQTLLGVTGSGKTFTVANVIQQIQKPTIVISHNKTLAAQLCGEFQEFFPENAVEYFVSYYDYYQPEAYVPSTDTYIEKDSDTNEEIDRLRYSATAALAERRDVIIVASVSCIYGLGSPVDYENQTLSLRPGMEKSRTEILRKLVDIQFSRSDVGFERGTFRVRGDVIDIIPAGSEQAVRVELLGDEIESIKEMNPLTGEITGIRKHISIFPASHYVTSKENMDRALVSIEAELEDRLRWFKDRESCWCPTLGTADPLRSEMLRDRDLWDRKLFQTSDRHPRARPYTLLDYFPEDFLIVIDESHAMIPQLRAMHVETAPRKTASWNTGSASSALDNRPMRLRSSRSVRQVLYISATPAAYERENPGLSTRAGDPAHRLLIPIR